jgi:hypothetical protein
MLKKNKNSSRMMNSLSRKKECLKKVKMNMMKDRNIQMKKDHILKIMMIKREVIKKINNRQVTRAKKHKDLMIKINKKQMMTVNLENQSKISQNQNKSLSRRLCFKMVLKLSLLKLLIKCALNNNSNKGKILSK